jgi:hypothetical protein
LIAQRNLTFRITGEIGHATPPLKSGKRRTLCQHRSKGGHSGEDA